MLLLLYVMRVLMLVQGVQLLLRLVLCSLPVASLCCSA
jgi:hypothetical protein